MKTLFLLPLLLGQLLLPAFALSESGSALNHQPTSVKRVVDRYYDKVESRLEPRFRFADVAWPPRRVSLVAFKEQARLEVWAEKGGEKGGEGEWIHIHDYPIRALSGSAGPKLRQGDRQVPEGFYRITWLNPYSSFHLSLKLDYPNVYDREQARNEGRGELGGDIFIHGEEASRGCLAMGNTVIEDLFVLTALVGKENVSVLIAARDFRVEPLGAIATSNGQPEWVATLNRDIAAELHEKFPLERK
jgi:hypothetical protein